MPAVAATSKKRPRNCQFGSTSHLNNKKNITTVYINFLYLFFFYFIPFCDVFYCVLLWCSLLKITTRKLARKGRTGGGGAFNVYDTAHLDLFITFCICCSIQCNVIVWFVSVCRFVGLSVCRIYFHKIIKI